jgi:phosphate-selective porin
MKKIIVFICLPLISASVIAQQTKVSGYIQTQYQWGEKDAGLKVGLPNENPEKSFGRIGIRRGRVKLTHEEGIAKGVFQVDFTEKGIGIKDAFLNLKAPGFPVLNLRAGIFNRPFGHEIDYSSSLRESPERSTVFQTLFPDERDLGAMLVLHLPQASPGYALKLEAGLFAGNGIKQETDSKRDFIGHLSAEKTIGSDGQIGLGISYYRGKVYQGTEKVFAMNGKTFVLNEDSHNAGQFARREYFGFDVQWTWTSIFGLFQLRAEYLSGQQPGISGSSKSPNESTLPKADTYIRNFSGGYVILIQDLGRLPLSAVLKYDRYDPNRNVSGHEVGKNGTGNADLLQNTWGGGILWRIERNFRLQAFYEINRKEKSVHIAGLENRKENVFTLRLQYKF